METLCIIPARGGSTRISRKNLKKLGGIPLIGRAVKTALSSKRINRVIVSTEDKEIASVAKKYGAEIPFIRPIELTWDTATAPEIIKHALRFLKESEGYSPDIIVWLYATTPLLKSAYVDEGIKRLIDGKFDSVVSACKARPYYLWMKRGNQFVPLYKKRVNSQDAEVRYRETGAFYIMTYETIMNKNTTIGKKTDLVLMDETESVDINEPSDFIIAEAIAKYKSSNVRKHT